jgi:opacity protein-like surface antigen
MRKILLLIFTLWTAIIFGQTTSISPYSGFGIGEIAPKGYDRSFAMGGVGIAFNDSLSINAMNPASYSFFVRQNPMFQIGMKMQSLSLTSELNSNRSFNFAFNNFVLGFPLAKRGGLVLGINPATTVGYNIVVAEEYKDADDQIFPVFNKFEGSGGYNKFFLGGAYRLYEKTDSLLGVTSRLSIGFNFSFYAGKKFSKLNVLFGDDGSTFKNTKYTLTEIIRDFSFNFGLQYTTYLRKTSKHKYLSLSVGAIANIPKYMNTSFETLIHTYRIDASGVEANIDTIFFSDDLKGKTFLPIDYGIGIMFDINKKWQIGADYEGQNWSNFNKKVEGIEIRNDNITNMFRVGVGLHFNPCLL